MSEQRLLSRYDLATWAAVHPESMQIMGHIAALEQELDALRNERARKAETEAQCAHLASTRTGITVEATDSDADIVAALCDEVDAARKERDQHKQSAETWRKRVEQAAEALADVLPGEAGRLDLLARVAELRRQRDEWRRRAESLLKQAEGFEADLPRIKPSGQVAEMRDRVALMVGTRERAPQARADLDALAAKAQGYEAAVADNAALLEELKGLVADMHTLMAKLVSRGVQVTFTLDPRLQAMLDGDHPGAALLEQHAKETDALKEALESQEAESHTLRRAFLHERHRADSAGAPPEHAYNAEWAKSLLADERRALVRARNEGLEKAAGVLEMDAANSIWTASKRIRAMKEPEE